MGQRSGAPDVEIYRSPRDLPLLGLLAAPGGALMGGETAVEVVNVEATGNSTPNNAT